MISKLRPLIGTKPQSSALAGILFMLGSVTIFSLANAFSKAMVATYPPAEVFFVRGFGALAILLPLLAQNNLLSFPYRWGFTPRSLARLLQDVGLTVRGFRADVLVPIADEWTLPWAAEEERALKREMRAAARRDRRRAPWFELYAGRNSSVEFRSSNFEG